MQKGQIELLGKCILEEGKYAAIKVGGEVFVKIMQEHFSEDTPEIVDDTKPVEKKTTKKEVEKEKPVTKKRNTKKTKEEVKEEPKEEIKVFVKDWEELKEGETVLWVVDPELLDEGDPVEYTLPIEKIGKGEDDQVLLYFKLPDDDELFEAEEADDHKIYKVKA